jgi:hypothetical protein
MEAQASIIIIIIIIETRASLFPAIIIILWRLECEARASLLSLKRLELKKVLLHRGVKK